MARAQYQHYLPRFILKPFAEDKNLHVYNTPTNRTQLHSMKSAFGELNMYRTANGKDDVEHLLMILETDTSRAFSQIKKAAGNPMENSVQLFDADIDNIKKFFVISSLRTGLFRDHLMNVHTVDGFDGPTETGKSKEGREIWLGILRYVLQTPFLELLSPSKEHQASPGKDRQDDGNIDNAIEICRVLAEMQLYIWEAPLGKEFLLGDPLVGIEGRVKATSDGRPKAPHFFIPISPTVIVFLCEKTCCKARSMISGGLHAPPKLRTLPGKKKPGQRGYKAPREAWMYPIAACSESHLSILNCHILSMTRVVYRGQSTFVETKNSIIEFSKLFEGRKRRQPTHIHKTTRKSPRPSAELEELRKMIFSHVYDMCLRLDRIVQETGPVEGSLADLWKWFEYYFSALGRSAPGCQPCEDELLREIPAGWLRTMQGFI